MGEWQKLCDVSEVPDCEGRCVQLGTEKIAVFNVDGEFFAISDRCPHEDVSLAGGWVENGEVECPLHQSRFKLTTGDVLCPPARENVKTYQVRRDGDAVLVSLS